MIKVSFTKFLDFIAQTGEPKATTALQAWRQSNIPYNPAHDYHRRIRQELIDFERSGNEPDWEQFVESQNPKKQMNYQETIEAYFKWRTKNTPSGWIAPPRGLWSSPEFQVTVNPEMGLELDGTPHAVKLFINKNKLSKLKAQMAGLMMHKALHADHPNMKFSIFDIKESKLHTYSGASEKLEYLLIGETAHLSAMIGAIRNQ